jgi:hypothetical protein
MKEEVKYVGRVIAGYRQASRREELDRQNRR